MDSAEVKITTLHVDVLLTSQFEASGCHLFRYHTWTWRTDRHHTVV